MRPLSVLKRSSCFSPPDHHDNSLNQGIVTHSTDYQQDWPFIKRSPIWDAIELCITPPQKPHFLPLKKMKYYCREGLAIAQMVTFVKLVQRSLDLQVKDPVGMINDSLETLCELETHGFEVGSIRDRLHELLSLKSKIRCHEDKRIEVEKELEKCHHEKRLVEKEMDELEAKMQLLKERTAQTATMRKAKEEEMLRLQSNLHLVSDQMNDWQLTFEKLVATPL